MFLDFMMSDGDGFQLMMDLPPEHKRDISIVFMTGFVNQMIKEDSLYVGAKAYLDKVDISIESIKKTLKKVV